MRKDQDEEEETAVDLVAAVFGAFAIVMCIIAAYIWYGHTYGWENFVVGVPVVPVVQAVEVELAPMGQAPDVVQSSQVAKSYAL